MVYLATVIGILLLCALLLPFWFGEGGRLQSGSALASKADLEAMQKAILKRYQDDEAAFTRGDIGRGAWEKRQSFLINRYVDMARRLDVLTQSGEVG